VLVELEVAAQVIHDQSEGETCTRDLVMGTQIDTGAVGIWIQSGGVGTGHGVGGVCEAGGAGQVPTRSSTINQMRRQQTR